MTRSCSKCGSAVAAGDKFCTVCGAAQTVAVPAAPERDTRSSLLWLGAGLAVTALAAAAIFSWQPGERSPSALRDAGKQASPPARSKARQRAQPKPPSDPLVAQARRLKNELVGRTYVGDLPITEYEDQGGGLMREPIWYSIYQRGDGTWLALINIALPRRPDDIQGTFRVADILLVPPLRKNEELSFACRLQAGGSSAPIVGIAVTDYDNEVEWWPTIRKAWSISLHSGQTRPIDPIGVECVNEGWGL